MNSNTKRIAFIAVNVILVAIVGVILGLCLPVTSDSALLLSYILLLVTLCTPTLMFLTVKDINSPIGIGSLLFIVANVSTLIAFLCTKVDIKVVGIVEGAVIGVYLIYLLIVIACSSKEEDAK